MPKPHASTNLDTPLSPYTLLAVTALAVSNLMVGIMQANTFLMLASAGLSAAFAMVYAYQSGMLSSPKRSDQAASVEHVSQPTRHTRFPLWLFIAVIFVMMPAVLLFLQTVEF